MKIRSLFAIIATLLISATSQAQLVVNDVISIPRLPDSGDSVAASVVSISISLPGVSDYGSFCTGSLIQRNKVLTAAHCLESLVDIARKLFNDNSIDLGTLDFARLSASGIKLYVNFAPTFPLQPLSDGKSIRVIRASVKSGVSYESQQRVSGTSSNNGNDVAVLTLGSNAPLSAHTLPLTSSPQQFFSMRALRMYGFNWAGSKGQLRYVETSGLSAELLSMEADEYREFLFSARDELTAMIPHFVGPGRSPCPGTSGGPITAVENGRWVQVGIIIEAGGQDCINSNNLALGTTSWSEADIGTELATSVYTNLDWILAR